MKFIDFASSQIKENRAMPEDSGFKDFISEYISLCDREEGFTERLNKAFVLADKEKTIRDIEKLKEKFGILEDRICAFLEGPVVPEVIFFIGNPGWDGHGIIIQGKPYVFFNMTILSGHHMVLPDFSIDIHILHELFHGIHYHLSPEFYQGNYHTSEDRYFKKMLAEGIATYLSGKLTGGSEKEALTFGCLSEEDFRKFIRDCETLKKDFWLSMQDACDRNREDKELSDRLFCIPDMKPDALARGRYGYYYGLKIAEKIAEETGDRGLLTVKDIKGYIKEYFENVQ